jgi:hypothetical protein
MKKSLTKLFFFGILCLAASANAQTENTVEDDFSNYGDADTKVTKSYCNQKVNYLTPSKLISIGFEGQGGFSWNSANATGQETTNDIRRAQGLRLMYSTPVVSRTNLLVNLAVSHWETGYNPDNAGGSNPVLNALDTRGLRTSGLQATIFKPFNSKNFLLIQAQADVSGDYRQLSELSGNNLTYSGVAVYGWKKNDNLLWGVGAARTYRLGQLIYVPVVLWNKTFNSKWGVEMLLPARAVVRRNFGTTSLVTAGFELEGNTFYMNNVGYLRRGEIKPRITYERQLKNFIWMTAQVGWRYNGRFDVFSDQNPVKNEAAIWENTIGNPIYFNIGIHLVSP